MTHDRELQDLQGSMRLGATPSPSAETQHNYAVRIRPASVRYNDWRQVDVPAPEAFVPTLPVSVIIPYYQTPAETLERTLAALEGQAYPRDLFEVVIVDDGSEPPLERPRSTLLDIKVLRQERCGYGLARARNTGVRAAAHDILLFLDSDMLVEMDWMVAHARWHHVVSDALTMGTRGHVAMDGIDAEMVRRRTGSLKELFSDRPADRSWVEAYLLRSNDLTSRIDDLYKVLVGANFGIRRHFYELVGGFDESFVRWGLEDTEFGYRAYSCGGLLVPVRDAFAWHQGRRDEDKDSKRQQRRRQLGKASHLIAHEWLRRNRPGRVFTVPQYVVTVDAGHRSAVQVIETAGAVLADRVHDLVVRIETQAGDDDDERLAWLRDEFGADPRVRVGSAGSAPLDEFPAASFHVKLPATVVFAKDLVYRLRMKLGDAVTAVSVLPDGSRVSITRAWALHRARRAGGSPADFGEARTIRAKALRLRVTERRDDADHATAIRTAEYPGKWKRLLNRMRDIRSPGEARSFLKRLSRRSWEAIRRDHIP